MIAADRRTAVVMPTVKCNSVKKLKSLKQLQVQTQNCTLTAKIKLSKLTLTFFSTK